MSVPLIFALFKCKYVGNKAALKVKIFVNKPLGQVAVKNKDIFCQNWFDSVDRASACGLKGLQFDSCQGHVPWLREHSQ